MPTNAAFYSFNSDWHFPQQFPGLLLFLCATGQPLRVLVPMTKETGVSSCIFVNVTPKVLHMVLYRSKNLPIQRKEKYIFSVESLNKNWFYSNSCDLLFTLGHKHVFYYYPLEGSIALWEDVDVFCRWGWVFVVKELNAFNSFFLYLFTDNSR